MTESRTEKASGAVGPVVAASYPACREKAKLLHKGFALAPMVRASTTPLRLLALQYGADFTYTEELVDRSLSQTLRVENKELQTIDFIKDPAFLPKKTKKKLKADNNRPCLILRIDPKAEKDKLICQIGTGEPELALDAAKKVVGDVAAIDVNMGCPKKFSVSGGMGSALLKDPDRAARILCTLKGLLGPLGKPLSCKIRLLATTQETVDFIEKMIRAGADAVAIHARRVGDESTKAADWKSLQEVLGIVQPKHPDINFLVNGDFYDRKERAEFVERTKVDGVLLARPGLYNTSTFLPLEKAEVDKTIVIQEYVKYSVRYDSHHKNSKYVVCEMMSHRRTPTGRVPYLPMKFPQGQTVGKTCNCHDLESLCKLWNVDYSKALATSAPGSNADSASSATTTLAPGEHRYEDSYFLKSEQANGKKDEEQTTAVEETNGTISADTSPIVPSDDKSQSDCGQNGDSVDNDSDQRATKRVKIASEEVNQPSI